MIDELTIYNLSAKYPNTVDLVHEVEKMVRAEVIEEILKNVEIGIEATGHQDQYTTGFCNALIWLKSCITQEEPMFLKPLELMNDERKNTIKDVIEMLVNVHGYSPYSVIIKDIEKLKEQK